jgi:YrbI family 3-deoxy-D-manno-octulosonate 8-phosphate phosphatase
MEVFIRNIEGLLKEKGIAKEAFLNQFGVNDYPELSLAQIVSLSSSYSVNFENILAFPHYLRSVSTPAIKLLILDVDGVMTDAGMYFTESGDQIKKYNAKDGMAIMRLSKHSIQTGIISSGFKTKIVKDRANLLMIDHFYVGRGAKIEVLKEWSEKLNIPMNEIAMIGDDINDLEVMKAVGFSACPADAVDVVKNEVDVVLFKKGGEGCVRELIDRFILPEPIQ